jgi:hypothetical protein
MPSPAPEPVQAPAGQPAHTPHRPLAHWVSAVHQHATPAAPQAPPGAVTVSQSPTAQDHAVASDTSVWQRAPSIAPEPVHEPVH